MRKTAIIEIKTSTLLVEAHEFDTLDLQSISNGSSEIQSENDFLQAIADSVTSYSEDLEEEDLEKTN